MNRRNWLTTLATGSATGLALLAGCSAITGGDSNNVDASGDNGDGDSTADAGTGGNSNNKTGDENGIDDGATTPETAKNGATASDQALDTGQAPPSETGTPFENTNTVPEKEGLETGQAPNATNRRS